MKKLWDRLMLSLRKLLKEKAPSPIAEKVNNALVDHAYSQLHMGLYIALTAATIILFGSYRQDNSQMLVLWYIIFFVVSVLRASLIKAFQYKVNALNYSTWRTLFIISALVGGATWGLAGVILFPSNNMIQQVLIVLTIAGVSAGSITTLSAIPKASFAFLFATLFPFVVHIAIKTQVFSWIVIVFLIFFFYLFLLAIRMHAMIKNLIFLNFENISLLENLSSANQELSHWAMYDPLTKISNRRVFYVSLESAIRKAKLEKSQLALLYIDLDGFKYINDTFGHDLGDKVLCLVTDNFKKVLRSEDLLARVGGDEFTVVIEKIKSKRDVEAVAAKLCMAIEHIKIVDNHPVEISLSIGASFFPSDGDDSETLIKAADQAMYHAKKQGGNMLHFLD
jgi:diguanylate cyclase (GGDEF)-like protein